VPVLRCTSPPSVCILLSLKRLTRSQHTHIHTHTLSLSLSLPFLSPFCSGRATNNRSPLYLSLHHMISDRCALVLTTFLPSYSPNSHVDHSSIVQIGCPSEAVSLFRFAVLLFIPICFQFRFPCLWQSYTLTQHQYWASHHVSPKASSLHRTKNLSYQATTPPCLMTKYPFGLSATSRIFKTSSIGHQSGL